MQEIVPDVFSWSAYQERQGYDFNGHLIRDPGGNICIDPVQPNDAVLDELGGMGATRIILTNRNHCRAAGQLRTRLGARTAIHPDDAAYARGQGVEIDDLLSVGEEIGPCTVIAVPGKSPGEIALHWPERGILIVGDAIIGDPPGSCRLLPDKVMDDPARLRQSLRALLDLEFETLLVGDGVSILTDAKQRLRELTSGFAD
jgi:glyoxylase-like metal-dependent hydrolase (beta-lactamase superfamily II)